jgi:Na+/phosphate symporter
MSIFVVLLVGYLLLLPFKRRITEQPKEPETTKVKEPAVVGVLFVVAAVVIGLMLARA